MAVKHATPTNHFNQHWIMFDDLDTVSPMLAWWGYLVKDMVYPNFTNSIKYCFV
ncbi:hypothetical protein C1H46_020008 [Malus baccata]|uniref:Uncharacterized protein n=1 Tax=Malus baccata TaxID=106549 RepID=A0A540M779_MALBA|nr:hypothetical protein C1H46_020008 [Malus baccata]